MARLSDRPEREALQAGWRLVQRYFFHLSGGSDFRDEDGAVLADLMAAQYEAIRIAGVLIAAPDLLLSAPKWIIEVTNGAEVVFTLSIRSEAGPSAAA